MNQNFDESFHEAFLKLYEALEKGRNIPLPKKEAPSLITEPLEHMWNLPCKEGIE